MSKRKVISTPHAPCCDRPYSQAIRWRICLFASGQLGLGPGDRQSAVEGIEAQTRQALTNLQAVLAEAGGSVGQCRQDNDLSGRHGDFATVNALYAEVFRHEPPARSTVQVAALPKGGLVEIEIVALLDE
jgi:2-iminobutanoate/2-iminopropanoate deaminase